MSTVDCTNEPEVGGVYVGSVTIPVEGTNWSAEGDQRPSFIKIRVVSTGPAQAGVAQREGHIRAHMARSKFRLQ